MRTGRDGKGSHARDEVLCRCSEPASALFVEFRGNPCLGWWLSRCTSITTAVS